MGEGWCQAADAIKYLKSLPVKAKDKYDKCVLTAEGTGGTVFSWCTCKPDCSRAYQGLDPNNQQVFGGMSSARAQ